MDEWGSHALLQRFEQGGNWLLALVQQHNEHRVAFTRLIFLGNDLAFGGHRLPLLLLNWLVMAATIAALAIHWRRRQPVGSWGFSLWLVAASCWLFHPAAGGVWLWAFALQIPLCQLFFVLAVLTCAQARASGPGLWCAVALAVASVLSSANGLITLPVLVAMAVGYRARWATKAVLAACTLLVTGAYFVGYRRPPHGQALAWGPTESLSYFLAFLGAPFGVNHVGVAAAFGALGCMILGGALFLWLRRRHTRDWESLAPWFCLMAMPLGSAAMGALGRTGFGVEQALQSRYLVVSGLFWAALAACLIALVPHGDRARKLGGAILGGVMALAFFVTQFGYVAYYHQKYPHVAFAAQAMRAGAYHPELWTLLHPDPAYILPAASYHRQRGLVPFDRRPALIGSSLAALGVTPSRTPIAGGIDHVSALPALPTGFAGAFWPAAELSGYAMPSVPVERLLLVDRGGTVRGVGTFGFVRGRASFHPRHLLTPKNGWRAFAEGPDPTRLTAYVVYRGQSVAYRLAAPPP
jgi:hypothetical protein